MNSGSSSSSSSSSGGIGFTGALTILFIALKLTGVINWSWVWVLSPLWISFAAFILFLVLFFGGALLYEWRQDVKRAKRRQKSDELRRQRLGL